MCEIKVPATYRIGSIAADRLSDLIEDKTGVFISGDKLLDLFSSSWGDLSKLAHQIHEATDKQQQIRRLKAQIAELER